MQDGEIEQLQRPGVLLCKVSSRPVLPSARLSVPMYVGQLADDGKYKLHDSSFNSPISAPYLLISLFLFLTTKLSIITGGLTTGPPQHLRKRIRLHRLCGRQVCLFISHVHDPRDS